MLKIITVIGARPQIIKAAALSRAIRNHFKDQIREIIVHTGQHYDEKMSQVFIDELSIPVSDYNLSIGSGSHGRQTGRMIERLEEVFLEHVQQQLASFPGYAQVRRVAVLQEALTPDNGLLTPTLKLRRNRILLRYSDEVMDLYAGH